MPGELVIFDPTSEATGTQVAIDGATYQLMSHEYPTPGRRRQWASSPDTEGELPADAGTYENRLITITVRVAAASDAALLAAVEPLQQKVAKMATEQGTLRRVLPDGTPITFDVLEADIQIPSDKRWMTRQAADITMRFVCKPGGRGAEVDLGDNTTMTGPCLIFTEASVPGDLPALGRLVIDNDSSADQWWLVWGIQSHYYDAASSAALFYEAEGRTAMGGSAIAAGPAGASGGGSNVMRNTGLLSSYQAILSTQASGGGAHLSHVGLFRVFARVQAPASNAGTVAVALEWSVGDFRRFTQNSTVQLSPYWEGTWRLVDLGLVALQKATAGTQRWEGRIVAKSTVTGDDIDVDCLMLIPADEGSGEVFAAKVLDSPTALSARDEFAHAAGSLAGKTLPLGGVWSGAGSGTDFATGSLVARRTATNDTDDFSGRFAIAGTTNYTNIAVTTDLTASAGGGAVLVGVFARYVDINNWLRVTVAPTSGGAGAFKVEKMIAGGVFELAAGPTAVAPGVTYAVRLDVDAMGRWYAWLYAPGQTPRTRLAHGQDSALATGGTLATGKVGFYDGNTEPGASTREFDNFAAWVPPADAAIFAGQSLELRHNSVRREDSGGTMWAEPSAHPGDYLQVPASGQEGRTARIVVKPSRNDPASGPDTAADALSARLFVTPRFLAVPEP